MKNGRPSFRYNTHDNWYKGNTHLHSTASDGGKSIPEISELYAGAGYDFLFITDHWVSSDVAPINQSAPLLLLDGIELNGCDSTGAAFHVVCLGSTEGIREEDGLEHSIQKARDQNAVLILAHPYWCGNTLEDALRGTYDGVEVYNHVCNWLNGKSNGLIHWGAMLDHRNDTLCFAADDAHLLPEHPGWDGGWIVINAPVLSRESVLVAIRQGNFYSSCGPEIKSIEYDGESLQIECSPVQFIRLVGPSFHGWRAGAFEGELLEKASVEIPWDWEYMYIEIEDKDGKKAWSNTLFV